MNAPFAFRAHEKNTQTGSPAPGVRPRAPLSWKRSANSAPEAHPNDAVLLPPGSWRTPWIVFAFLSVVTVYAVYQYFPPQPVGPEAAPTEFSSARAMKHIEAVASETHAMGTPENARVRDYLLGELNAIAAAAPEMNMVVEKDGAYVERETRRSPYRVYYVENVLARIPGALPTKAFMLMAHYDSTPYGPGAADDGSGVAAMLETARALAADFKAGHRLRNDIIFLFTDGEEVNLLGPKAFKKQRWYNDVGVVLNFEARGYTGPSMMFETSPHNGRLIREFAKAAPYPVATSLMYDVAGRMPTTTDYAVLKSEGIPGLNCAFIGGIKYYHTRNDSPAMIDQGSLQHHGTYALSLSRHFGNLDLTHMTDEDYVYFNAIGSYLVRYPVRYALPICIGVAALFLVTLAYGLRRRWLTWKGMALSFLTTGFTLITVALVVAAVLALAWVLHQQYLLYNTGQFFLGFVALTLGLLTWYYAGFRRRIAAPDLHAGAMLWVLPLLIGLHVYAPSGSYLIAWPLFFGTLMLGGSFALYRIGAPAWIRFGWLVLCAVPVLMLLVPTVYGFLNAVTVIPSPFWMIVVLLTAGLLAPHVAILAGRRTSWFAKGALLAAVLLLLPALFWLPFTPESPKMNTVCYGLNFDRGQAVWISSDNETDEWTAQFFPDGTPRAAVREFRPDDGDSYLRAPAPIAPLQAPQVRVVDDSADGAFRNVKLHVTSGRAAPLITLYAGPETEVYAAQLNGIALGDEDGAPQNRRGNPWGLRYHGLSEQGLDLELRVAANVPLELSIIEESYGFPEIPNSGLAPRPHHMITEPNTVEWWRRFRSNVVYSAMTWREN